MNIPNKKLKKLLAKATEEELLAITKSLDKNKKNSYSPKKIQSEICTRAGNSVANGWRGFDSEKLFKGLINLDTNRISDSVNSEGISYLELLEDMAKELKIELDYSYPEKANEKYKAYDNQGKLYQEDAEVRIATYVLRQQYKKMSPEERAHFDEQMKSLGTKDSMYAAAKVGGTAGLMLLAKAGGFGTYMMLSTALSTVSIGSLPMGAYLAASTAMSFAIGASGGAALVAYGAYELCSPNIKKLIPAVILIGSIRQRIKVEKTLAEDDMLVE